jgi:hypothetical protein
MIFITRFLIDQKLQHILLEHFDDRVGLNKKKMNKHSEFGTLRIDPRILA